MATNESVWTWLRDGIPPAYFFRNEHSLLVSYDIMPLRGLDVTKKILNKKGHIVKGHFVITQDTNVFVPYLNGNLDIDAVDWGCHGKGYDRCFYSLAHYVYNNETMSISNEDNDVLRMYHLLEYERDGRKRRPLKKFAAKAEDIINGIGYSINSVAFVPEVK